MCHRFHKSRNEEAEKGRSKFSGKIRNHTFPPTPFAAYLKKNDMLDAAWNIANHESPRTAKLYDSRQDEISLDERIAI
jgi:hypothetical protein